MQFHQSIFHESYYEHTCRVECEKDILYSEIPDNNTLDRLKRWWKDLFLLSHDDIRCKIYFSSSQAMRTDRVRQYQFYPQRIHPLSKFSTFWNYFISILVLFNCSIVNNTMSVTFGDMPIEVYITALIVEFIIIFDFYIQFKTGYIDEESKKVVLSAKKRFLQYSSTKLFLHSICAIPLQTIMAIRYGSNLDCLLCKANRFNITLRFFSIIRLIRLFEATQYWIREGRPFKTWYLIKFIRICIIGIITSFSLLNMATAVSLLYAIHNKIIYDDSALALLLRYRYWNTQSYSLGEYIVMKISKAIKCFFFFGFTYSSTFYLDNLFALIEYFVSNLFLFWGVMIVFAVLNRSMCANDKKLNQMERTISMMKSMQISDQISEKVLDYYHFNVSRASVVESSNELYRFLPTSVLKEIKVTMYCYLLKRIPYFQDWPIQIVEDLAIMLKEDIFLPDDTVSQPWYAGSGLMIVETGVLAVFSTDGEETGHLIDGDYFGLLSLVTDREVRSSYVKATERSKVLTLYKNDFRLYMQAHSDLFFDLRQQLNRHYRPRESEDNNLDQRVEQ